MAICRGRAEGQRGPVRSPGAHSFTCQQVGVSVFEGDVFEVTMIALHPSPQPRPSEMRQAL